MRITKSHLKVFNIMLFFVALYFIGRYFINSYGMLSLERPIFNIHYFVISCFLVLLAQLIQALLWAYITKELNIYLGFWETLNIRLKNELVKYIPGKVAQFGSIIIDYQNQNKAKSKVSLGIGIENVLSIFGGLICSIFFVQFIIKDTLIVLIICGVILLISFFSNRIILKVLFSVYAKLKGIDRTNLTISPKMSRLYIYYTLTWALFGLSFLFLLKSFEFANLNQVLSVISIFSISSFIGFIAFFAPAGLGFREGSLSFLLDNYLTKHNYFYPIIISRLQVVISDVILYILVSTVIIIRNKVHKNI